MDSPGRILASLAVLLAVFVPCAGADDAARQAAERLVALRERGDEEGFRREARALSGDPWLVAEALFEADAEPAARAFGRLVARDLGVAALEDYVAWRAAHPPPADAIRRVREAADLSAAGAHGLALERLGDPRDLPSGVLGVRHLRLRAELAAATGAEPDTSIGLYERSVDLASGLGWPGPALDGLARAVNLAASAGLTDRRIALAERGLDLARSLGLRALERRWHDSLARALREGRRVEEATEHARRAWEGASSPEERRDSLRYLLILEIEGGRRIETARHLPMLRALEERLGNRRGVAAADVQIASSDATFGRLASALERLHAALGVLDAEGEPGERRGAHVNAAKTWLLLRDGTRVREHLRRAREAGGASPAEEGTMRLLAGCSHLLDDRPAEAEAALRSALPLLDAAPLEARFQARLNLAVAVAADARRADEALAAADSARALLPPDSSPLLRLAVDSTECLVRLRGGDLDGAIEAGLRARSHGPPEVGGQWSALLDTRLAHAWLRRGETARALESARAAVRAVVSESAALPDRVGAQFRAELDGCFAVGLEAAARAGDAASFFELAESARALALRSRLEIGDLVMHGVDPELRDRELELEELEAQAVGAYRGALAGGDGAAIAARFAELGGVRSDLERHRERILARQAVAGHAIAPHADALEDVRRALPADEALLVLASGLGRTHALVATREGARLVSLGDSDRLERLLRTSLLEDPGTPAEDAVRALRAAIARPLALAEGLTRLRIAPSGALAAVPFAALWPDVDLALLPSATVGRLLSRRAGPPGRRVLAVGVSDDGMSEPLRGAGDEARAVGDEVLVAEEATEGALRQRLAGSERWRAVHLACHGLVDPRQPLRSALSLRPSEGRDGLWTVSEILGTRVVADLVVLSACSTARGRALPQEGVLGFAHAFFVAGARRVLSSLWSVDDRATAVFMRRFYEAWRDGREPAAALRAAQAALRADPRFSHPAHWAGWQLWG